MINRRFLRPNAANSMQNEKFQRQNAANSMQHGRFSSKMLQITRKMKGSSSKMLQIACSMEGKWQDRCRGRKTEQITKKIPGAGEKIPRRDSAPSGVWLHFVVALPNLVLHFVPSCAWLRVVFVVGSLGGPDYDLQDLGAGPKSIFQRRSFFFLLCLVSSVPSGFGAHSGHKCVWSLFSLRGRACQTIGFGTLQSQVLSEIKYQLILRHRCI